MKQAHYIVTVHNKEDLLEKVLDGITSCTANTDYNVNIICVLDGCTDRSEEIADSYQEKLTDKYTLHKIHLDDVHELLSLNAAFDYLNTINTSPDDLVFLLQDDVILQQDNLNEIIEHLYNTYENLGYISFRCGLATDLDGNGLLYEHSFVESTNGHWKQLDLNHFVEMMDSEFGFCEIVIKSPTCIKKRILDHVGFFDTALAPFGHDDLDLCIRLNKLGYKNAIFGAKFTSKLDWGGTREDKNQDKPYHKSYNQIVLRNKKYLVQKHKDYYEAKQR